MHVLALSRQQRGVRRFGDEGVTEPVAPRGAVGDEQPVVDRLAQRLDDLLPRASGMAAVSTAGGTARPAAAAKRTTARVGACRRSKSASSASWSSSGSSGSSRSAAAISSSAKNGLPSARAQTDSTSSGHSGPSLSRATSAASSSRVSGPSSTVNATRRRRSPEASRCTASSLRTASCRHVATISTRPSWTACARKARRSSVDPSAQCRSSSTSTTGAVALRRSSAVRTASNRCSCDSPRVPHGGRGERRAGQQARQLLQPVEGGACRAAAGAPRRAGSRAGRLRRGRCTGP